MTETLTQPSVINGINVEALRETIEAVRKDPSKAQTKWSVTTDWVSGTVSKTHVSACEIGGERVERYFDILIDEPFQLCGYNTHANPQEYLLASLNACMTVGYVAGASLFGVKLQSLRIETEGDIDLRGFLGVSQTIPAGYKELRYTVHIKGDGTPKQMQKIHELVMATSPNRFSIGQPVALKAKLVVE